MWWKFYILTTEEVIFVTVCYLKRCGNVYYRCMLMYICMSVYNWIMCKVLILQLFSLTLKVKRVWFSTVTISHMTVHKIYVMSSNVQGGIMLQHWWIDTGAKKAVISDRQLKLDCHVLMFYKLNVHIYVCVQIFVFFP